LLLFPGGDDPARPTDILTPEIMTHDFRHVPVARSVADRARGLIGRTGRLMIFIPQCGSIHTAFVKAAIDVIFVDRENRILSIDAGVRPWRVRIGPRGSKSVLELPDGEAAKSGLHVGDTIEVG
jgi:uncharacterized membrane protein (UPF0127 family)